MAPGSGERRATGAAALPPWRASRSTCARSLCHPPWRILGSAVLMALAALLLRVVPWVVPLSVNLVLCSTSTPRQTLRPSYPWLGSPARAATQAQGPKGFHRPHALLSHPVRRSDGSWRRHAPRVCAPVPCLSPVATPPYLSLQLRTTLQDDGISYLVANGSSCKIALSSPEA